jgi:hypothetical protein
MAIPKTMRAAVVEKFREPLVIRELPVPTPGPGQALVEIIASGVCHTDLHAADGDWPVKPGLPVTPGHEGAGIVVALGPGVTHLKEGDSNRANQGGVQIPESILSSRALSVPAMLCFKGATEGLAFSSPRLGRTATISPALVAGAGMHIRGGTCGHIPLRAGRCCRLLGSRMF